MKENVLKEELNVSIEFLERFCRFNVSEHTEEEILSKLEKEEQFKVEKNSKRKTRTNKNV